MCMVYGAYIWVEPDDSDFCIFLSLLAVLADEKNKN
jgi:hypothetical protein